VRARRVLRLKTLAAAATALSAAAGAEASWLDRVEWRGIVEMQGALQTRDGEVQKWDFVFQPELTVDLEPAGRLTAIGRARFDPVDRLRPRERHTSNDFRSPPTRRAFAGDVAVFEVREFYLDRYVGDVFLRLGKQQIVWGEADGLRVLDIVNPFDFREFILPEFEDRRIPLWSAQAEVPLGPVTAQLLWLPDHTYDDIPEEGAIFAFTSPRVVPSVPAGGGLVPVVVEKPKRPSRWLVDDDYGVRFAAFLGGWDLSANYLYHYPDQPIVFRTSSPDGSLRFTPEYRRSHTVGGTFSNAFGDFTVRGELAYSTNRFFISGAATDADGVFDTSETAYVLGLDYQYDSDLFLSTQLFQSILTDSGTDATRDRVESTLSFLIEKEFLNDTVESRALLLQSINDGDGLLQVKIGYRWKSNVIVQVGADVFYGDEDGLFGEFHSADRITLGVEIGF